MLVTRPTVEGGNGSGSVAPGNPACFTMTGQVDLAVSGETFRSMGRRPRIHRSNSGDCWPVAASGTRPRPIEGVAPGADESYRQAPLIRRGANVSRETSLPGGRRPWICRPESAEYWSVAAPRTLTRPDRGTCREGGQPTWVIGAFTPPVRGKARSPAPHGSGTMFHVKQPAATGRAMSDRVMGCRDRSRAVRRATTGGTGPSPGQRAGAVGAPRFPRPSARHRGLADSVFPAPPSVAAEKKIADPPCTGPGGSSFWQARGLGRRRSGTYPTLRRNHDRGTQRPDTRSVATRTPGRHASGATRGVQESRWRPACRTDRGAVARSSLDVSRETSSGAAAVSGPTGIQKIGRFAGIPTRRGYRSGHGSVFPRIVRAGGPDS